MPGSPNSWLHPQVESRRNVVLVALCGVLMAVSMTLGPSSIAAASTYPPPPAVLSLSDRVLPPSTPFVATVTGCQPGETVTFFLVGNAPVSVICGPNGVATTTLISPSTPGTYDVTAVLASTGITLVDSIRVALGSSSPSIPRAGSGGVSTMLLLGAGLVVFGGVFVAVARLRRRDASAALARVSDRHGFTSRRGRSSV